MQIIENYLGLLQQYTYMLYTEFRKTLQSCRSHRPG